MGRSIEIIKDLEDNQNVSELNLGDMKLVYQANKNKRKLSEEKNRNKVLYFNQNERPFFNENVDRNAEKYTETKSYIPLQVHNCKCIECSEKGSNAVS